MKLFCWSLILILSLGSAASADLVAYWPFDTDPNNAQGNPDFDGVVTGTGVSFSDENVAVGTGALKIDDNTISGAHFVKIENSPFVGVETKFSIVGWFLPKDISGDGSDSRQFVLETNNNRVSFGGHSTGEVGEWYLVGSPNFSDTSGPFVTDDPNAWRHFALVYNAEVGYGQFYFDGQLRDDRSGTPGPGLNATEYLNIGDFRDGSGGRNFDGYIDDMAVFDRALTKEQVLALYDKTHTPDTVEQILDLKASRQRPVDGTAHINGGALLSWQAPEEVADPVYNVYLSTDPAMANDVRTLATDLVDTSIALPSDLPDATNHYWRVDTVGGEQGEILSFTTVEGLVAYWPFDTDPNNAQGNTDFDGIAIGNAVVSTDDVKVGTGALKIDDDTQSSNYVDIASAPIVTAQDVYSVVGWYKYSDISSNGSDSRNFIFETPPGYAASFGIRDSGDRKHAQYYVQTGVVYNSDTASGPVVDDDNWHHVALVWNELTDTIKWYHDGSLFVSQSVGADVELVASDGFHIGSHRAGDGGRNWDGYLDDMAIFDVELMPAQISALFNGIRGPDDVLEELQLTATNPNPTMGGVADFDGQLSWQAPPDLADPRFNVYFSPDPNMVNDVITLAQDLDGTSVDLPAGLEYETQYYWRVDSTSGGNIYEGDIWWFVTPNEPLGLVAWWPFDDSANNAQGNSDLDGALIGNAIISSENVAVGTGALKIDDDLTGASYVDITSTVMLGVVPTRNTVVCWYLPKDISGDGSDTRNFIWEPDNNYSISFGVRSDIGPGGDTKVAEWYYNGSDGVQRLQPIGDGPVVAGTGADPNTWHHVAMVYDLDADSIKYYHDGELYDEATADAGVLATNPTGFHIGTRRDGGDRRNFDGYIDEVAIYDAALSSYQVQQLVTNPAVNCGNVLQVRKYWADFNGNGSVDLDDLRYFGERWLTDDPEADYDGNGNVDFFDFGTFGEGWRSD